MKECGLINLETRQLRGDQIEVFKNNNNFKILNGYENIDRNIFFSLKKDNRTRGHEVKLLKNQCRLDIRKYSFSQRTINEWNKLSTDCVTATSICLKTRLTHISGGWITQRLKMLDSQQATGFLVHLRSGPLPWIAILINLVTCFLCQIFSAWCICSCVYIYIYIINN